MRLAVENKSKLEVFVAIFQLLKNWSSHINMFFEKDKLYNKALHSKSVIENKETESGITIHYVNEFYDEGLIIHQSKCNIDSNAVLIRIVDYLNILKKYSGLKLCSRYFNCLS